MAAILLRMRFQGQFDQFIANGFGSSASVLPWSIPSTKISATSVSVSTSLHLSTRAQRCARRAARSSEMLMVVPPDRCAEHRGTRADSALRDAGVAAGPPLQADDA